MSRITISLGVLMFLVFLRSQEFAAEEAQESGKFRAPLRGAAPPFDLPDLQGTSWNLERLQGKASILVFGDLGNRNTLAALLQIQEIARPVIKDEKQLTIVLISAAKDPPEKIRATLNEKGLNMVVLRDPDHKSFSSYHVLVLPTTFIIDPGGNVVVSIAGHAFDYAERVTDGLLMADKTIHGEAMERVRTSIPQEEGEDSRRRALRLSRLAERLVQRGFPDLGEDEFKAALELDPKCIAARVGIGRLLILRKRLEEGEAELRKALEIDPQSLEAVLGLAALEVMRGGEELGSARKRLEMILEHVREEPEALFLLGRIAEAQKDLEGAVDFYKRAALRALQERGKGYERIVP